MGKNKYNKWIGDDDYDARDVKLSGADYIYSQQSQERNGENIPSKMLCSIQGSPGLPFGLPKQRGGNYVGVLQGEEGNLIVIGGNGSGKSAGIAKPALGIWQGAICATDIKGELSDYYAGLHCCGVVTRPYIILDPMQIEGPSYDPLWLLSHDSEDNLLNNVKEIAMAIAPVSAEDKQPFWAETEQGVLAAALLYYFKIGLSFSEIMCKILSSTMGELCTTLVQSGDIRVQMLLGEIATMKPETLANIDRGLRNKIMLFATDSYISHMFRGQREEAKCFTWEDLNTHNIFLRIPADKMEQWSGAVNLMYTLLIRHLERRPEKYSAEGKNNIQTLLLMDEFARFGKLEMITAAMATLRSKNVNICLMVQSIAQLDKIYGEYERRIILDNCQYQAILRANDADTQKYLCDLIGTHMHSQHSTSEHMDEDSDITGYSRQTSEIREWVVQPHELSTLDDVLLLTPYGFCRAEKIRPDDEMYFMSLSVPEKIHVEAVPATLFENAELQMISDMDSHITVTILDDFKINKGVRIMSIEERTTNANKRIAAAKQQQLLKQRREQDAQKKKDNHRSYIIGDLVAQYFPSVREYEPGTDTENQTRFESLEAFLYVLSIDYELVRELQDRAAQLVEEDPEGEWRLPR